VNSRVVTCQSSGRQFNVGGRQRPIRPIHPRMKLARFVTNQAALPTPPDSGDYSQKALAALGQMYLNDQEGDCVIAGGYHVLGTVTGNATGSPFIASPTEINADYGAIGNYVPGDPSTDNGCDEGTAITFWEDHGFADGSKLSGAVQLDATNQAEVTLAMWLFENVFYGMELPDGWIQPSFPAPGATWDVAGDPNPDNGHCVMGCIWTPDKIGIFTWGELVWLTRAASAQYAVPTAGGQLYALVSPEVIGPGQTKAPNGFDWPTLQAELASLENSFPQSGS
jgi:hypothetical protein